MQVNVLEYLEKGALASCPDKVAVIDNGASYTFAEIADRARSFAAGLIARNDVVSRPVAVYLPKGVETIIADLGILYSGNVYCNLDTKSPLARTKAILQNIDPVAIITNAGSAAALSDLDGGPERIVLIGEPTTGDAPYAEDDLLRRRERVLDTDPLCIINTSGSTGVPKGVVMNHRSVIDFMDCVMETLGLDGSEIIGSLSPFYFDIYTLELFLALAKGATIVIIPEDAGAFPARLAQFVAEQKINFVFWVPTIMVNMANQDTLAGEADLSCLRKVLFAGEVFPTKHLNYWRRHLPGARFTNLYGPIEITVDCTYFAVDREFDDDEPIPIGFPFRNTEILILNDDNQAAGENEQGELCVRGSSLALGYWNDPEKTAAAFVQNPLNTLYPELIYRTGDRVYKNERGEIMFVGRKDFQIKHLGYRIELGEIEHAIVSCGLVRNACVLYHKERKEITLFYEADEELAPATARRNLAEKLPKYMLPTVFVPITR